MFYSLYFNFHYKFHTQYCDGIMVIVLEKLSVYWEIGLRGILWVIDCKTFSSTNEDGGRSQKIRWCIH